MVYKTLKKVSDVCQLMMYPYFETTLIRNGITFTDNGDGTITANGTSVGFATFVFSKNFNFIAGNKYYVSTPYSIIAYKENGTIKYAQGNILFTWKSNWEIVQVYMQINTGITVSNLTFKPQLFDLTEMYGAGNEPTTVEQFRQDFPEEMYDYSPRCFVKSYKTLLKASNVCQLLDKSKYPATTTINGVTFTNNGDGSITVNGTAASGSGFRLDTFYIEGNRTYLMAGCPAGGGAGKYFMFDGYSKLGSDLGSGVIKTVSGSDRTLCSPILYVVTGQTVSNLVFKPQLFDLTEMYGTGNEPTTVEQFRQDFPEEIYDYKPYSTIPSYKKSLVCTTKNLFDINSVSNIDNWVASTTATRPYGYYTFYLKPNTTYTFSRKYASNNDRVFACFYEEYGVAGGQWFIHPTASSLTRKQLSFTTDDTGIMYLNVYAVKSVLSSFIELIEGAQLELGDKATDYVPYGHL